jgi:diguanylate cyclase (GGDEF)-like protein
MHEDTPQATSTQTIQQPNTRVFTGRKYPYLVVMKGRDTGKHFEISRPESRIGRSSQMEVTIDDDLISRQHCVILHSNGGFTLEDCRSKNGTFVDGRKADRATITPTSSIQLGRTLLKIEYKDRAEVQFEEELFRNATTDALTKAPNRFYFMRRATEELSLARRGAFSVTIVMIDLDNFKEINDSLGHQAGDFVLRSVAEIITGVKREEDLLGRYGGDEFIVMLRGQGDREAAQIFCERVREKIEGASLAFDGSPIHVTVSIGAGVRQGGAGMDMDMLIADADRAMYAAKDDGRNRIRVAE